MQPNKTMATEIRNDGMIKVVVRKQRASLKESDAPSARVFGVSRNILQWIPN